MTITVTSIDQGPFTATGLAQTVAYTFMTLTDEEISVFYDMGLGRVPVDGAGFVVTRNKNVDGSAKEGGSVALAVGAAPAGSSIYLRAAPREDRDLVWSDTGSRLKNLNEEQDRQVLRALVIKDKLDRNVDGMAEAGAVAGALAGREALAIVEANRRLFDKPLMDFVTNFNASDWKPYFDAAVDWAAANAPHGCNIILPRVTPGGGIPLSFVKTILSDGVHFVGANRRGWAADYDFTKDPCDIRLLGAGSTPTFTWGNNSYSVDQPGGFTQRGGGLLNLSIRGWVSDSPLVLTRGIIGPKFHGLFVWVAGGGIRIENGSDADFEYVWLEGFKDFGIDLVGTGEGMEDGRASGPGRGQAHSLRECILVGSGDEANPTSTGNAFSIRGCVHTVMGKNIQVVKGGGNAGIFIGDRKNNSAAQRPHFISLHDAQVDYVKLRCIDVQDAQDVWFSGSVYLNGSANENVRIGANADNVNLQWPRGFGSRDRMVTIAGKQVSILGGAFRAWDGDGVSTEPCIYVEPTATDVKIIGTTFGDPKSNLDTSAGRRALYAPPEATGSLSVIGCSFYYLAAAPVDEGGMALTAGACTDNLGQIKLEKSFGAVEALDYVASQAERRAILDGTNTGDQSSAILKAKINASIRGIAVRLSGGKWRISQTILLDYNGVRLVGSGVGGATTLQIIGATTKGIQTLDGINNWSVENLKITRSTAAAEGGVALDFSNVNSRGRIHNVWVTGHFNGVALGPTDFSEMVGCTVEKSVGDNIIMKNLSTDGTCQWDVRSVLSQMCGGRAFAFDAVAGPVQCIVGAVTELKTFASTGHGFAINGLPGTPVQDVRLQNSFVGESGQSCVYLNTYGKLHQINDCFIELAGRSVTGANRETPASNVGSGIEITANNEDVIVTGGRIDAHSHFGLRCEGGVVAMTGTRVLNNGLALSAGLRVGVRMFNAAKLFASNVTSTNTNGGTSQQIGIYMDIGAGCSITGGSVSGNSAFGLGAVADMHLCHVAGVEGARPIMPSVGTLGASYANDTAAAAGGVGLNELYRNGSVVMIRVV